MKVLLLTAFLVTLSLAQCQFLGQQKFDKFVEAKSTSDIGNFFGGKSKRQFFGPQTAQNMQNNQFAAPGQGGMMGRKKRQFFGPQTAQNMQNNQFASGGGGMGGGGGGLIMGGGGIGMGMGGALNQGVQNNLNGRKKRQFFGPQTAQNMQNNQFAAGGGGMGGGGAIGIGGGMPIGGGVLNQGVQNNLNPGFGRKKRQFFGPQTAQNMQNNQFAAGGGMGGGGGMIMGGGGGMGMGMGGALNQGVQNNLNGRKKRQFFGPQTAQNMQNNQFAAPGQGGMGK